jgi:hypothetical protein
MGGPIGSNEIRVVIRTLESCGFEAERVPAQLFKRTFDAFLAALIAADRELNPKSQASEFFISHLGEGSCEFGFVEKQRAAARGRPSAIELFKLCAGRVYRSDYQILQRYPRLMRAFHRIVKALDPAGVVLVRYHNTELPMDGFFCRQVDRVGEPERASRTAMWFAGAAIASFEGRLEAIDYRGPVWRGFLTAPEEIHLECVFDKSKGEDAFNRFGNKTVSVSGRAIYTGDSQLPERIEVLEIEELPRPAATIDIRGALARAHYPDWDEGIDNSQ